MSKWWYDWGKKEEETEFEKQQRKREIRERANGPDPIRLIMCDCGAKYDREFPNVHSPWCKVYSGNK